MKKGRLGQVINEYIRDEYTSCIFRRQAIDENLPSTTQTTKHTTTTSKRENVKKKVQPMMVLNKTKQNQTKNKTKTNQTKQKTTKYMILWKSVY